MKYQELLITAKKYYEKLQFNVNYTYIDKLCNKAKNFSIVSFDVFDTLWTRLFECPIDLYAFIDKRLVEENQNLNQFGVNRYWAETRAREIAWYLYQREEITYDEIYNQLHLFYPHQRKAVETAKKLELEAEFDSIVVNTEQIFLIEKLKQLGKKIIFVSDTYLSKRFMEKILSNLNLDVYDKLYVSSDIMKVKYTGHLWSKVKKDNPEESILHIGDNLNADIYMSKKYGISSFHYTRLLGQSRIGAELKPDLVPFSLMNKIQQLENTQLAQKDQESKFWFEFGEILGGITLQSFIDWLKKEVIKDKIEHIYFLARDAQIIFRAWKLLDGDSICGTTSSYLHISRTSIRFPCCHIDIENTGELSEDSLYSLVEDTVLQGETWQEYFNRLNISENFILKHTNFIEKFGSLKNKFDYKYSSDFKKFIQEELIAILAPMFAREYEEAYGYFQQEGVFDNEKRFAIADIGWGGTNQLLLTKFREFLGIRKKIKGYYYGLLNQNAPGRLYYSGPMKSAFFNMFWKPYESSLMQNFMYILENLHSADHTTTSHYHYNKQTDEYEPVFIKDKYNQYINQYNQTYKLYQEGTIQTLEKWKNNELVYGIDKNDINTEVAISALYQICISPNNRERKFLGQIEHAIIYDHSINLPLIQKKLPNNIEDIAPMLYLWPCGVMSYWHAKKNKIDPELYKAAIANFNKFPPVILNYLIG